MSKRKLATLTDTNTSSKCPDDKPTVTIAIDFGTAGTGYAYSFAGSDVIEAKQPGGQDARKTLTNILLNPDGSLKAFGFEARRMYAENGEGNFFANYKMLLQNVTSKLPDPMAKSLSGQRVPLKSIIVKTLEYVKSEALKECGRAMPNGLTARDCQWVVTVPAMCAAHPTLQACLARALAHPPSIAGPSPDYRSRFHSQLVRRVEGLHARCRIQSRHHQLARVAPPAAGAGARVRVHRVRRPHPRQAGPELHGPGHGRWHRRYHDEPPQEYHAAALRRDRCAVRRPMGFDLRRRPLRSVCQGARRLE